MPMLLVKKSKLDLKDEYSKRADIPLHVLRMRLAYVFNKTASDDTMLAFSMLRQRQRRRLHKKASPAVAAVTPITPHLDNLFSNRKICLFSMNIRDIS